MGEKWMFFGCCIYLRSMRKFGRLSAYPAPNQAEMIMVPGWTGFKAMLKDPWGASIGRAIAAIRLRAYSQIVAYA
jgi:hypothetical protein